MRPLASRAQERGRDAAQARQVGYWVDIGQDQVGGLADLHGAHRRLAPHGVSMLSQQRATIGIRIPRVSSLGRAWLTWCAGEEREATLTLLRNRTDVIGQIAGDSAHPKRNLRETRRRGYAVNKGEWAAEASVTAIGVPVRVGEQAIGAITQQSEI